MCARGRQNTLSNYPAMCVHHILYKHTWRLDGLRSRVRTFCATPTNASSAQRIAPRTHFTVIIYSEGYTLTPKKGLRLHRGCNRCRPRTTGAAAIWLRGYTVTPPFSFLQRKYPCVKNAQINRLSFDTLNLVRCNPVTRPLQPAEYKGLHGYTPRRNRRNLRRSCVIHTIYTYIPCLNSNLCYNRVKS